MVDRREGRQQQDFDIAVSFADEDREYVENVVAALTASGVSVFYDRDHTAEMWGEDLIEYFDQVYRERSRYVIMFVSTHYANKMWTRLERRSALSRGLEQAHAYVLPVRLDDTQLPGLRPSVGYLDARQSGADGIVGMVHKKLGSRAPVHGARITHVPRMEVERQRLLLERPEHWEFLFFAAQLLYRKELLEPKYRDHQLGFAVRSGRVFEEEEMVGYLRGACNETQRLAAAFMKLVTEDALERAFGKPGEEGDPQAIEHLATRWNSIYEGLLDWSAELRGATVPSDFRAAVEALARFNDAPVEQYRQFVDDVVRRLTRSRRLRSTAVRLPSR